MPWRDLSERFGPWKSVYNRFSNWARKKRWEAIVRELQVEVDQTGSIVDGSVIRALREDGPKVLGPRASQLCMAVA